MTAVVAYHAHLGVRGGYVGVDVFLVVSGFLITGRLVRDLPADGARGLVRFYAHRVRRLMPASTFVLLTTVLAARFFGPPLESSRTASYGLFAAVSLLNHALASIQLDYLHAGAGPLSPVQHYWSLGVEEQFYLGWPLVVLVLALLVRTRLRGALVLVLVGLVAWSAYACATGTASNAAQAYFQLSTRVWELGVGALLAVALPWLERLPRRGAVLLSWCGAATVLSSCFALSEGSTFPGTVAWIPVLGAAALVAAGCHGRVGAEALLSRPAVQWLGRRSYSWYLWHWPLLVLVPTPTGGVVGVAGRVGVAVVSLATAASTYRFLEQPTRRSGWSTTRWLAFGVGATVVSLVVMGSVTLLPPDVTGRGRPVTNPPLPQQASAAATTLVGLVRTAAVTGGAVPSDLTPTLQDAATSVPPSSYDGCQASYTTVSQGACVYGDPSADRTVVLFGDSHAEQWLPALDRLGRSEHWRVVSWTKAACGFADLIVYNDVLQRIYTECDTWRAVTLTRIARLRPQLLVASQSEGIASADVSPERFAAASVRTLQRLREQGVARVEVVGEIPTPGSDVPGCLAEHLDDSGACAFDRADALPYPARHTAVSAALSAAGIPTLELVPIMCGETRCPVVVGDLLVYRNGSHVTVPWSLYLTPLLRPLLDGTAPRG